MGFKQSYQGFDIAIMQVTDRCQCNCTGCYFRQDTGSQSRLRRDMSWEDAVGILDACREFKSGKDIREAQILGGEPLLWPEWRRLVDLCVERNIVPHLYTNTLQFDEASARFCSDRGVLLTGKLNVSPDGGEVSEHAQAALLGFPGKSDMARKLFQQIRLLGDAGYGSDRFRVNNVLTKTSLPFAIAYYDWCLRNNVGVDFEMPSSGKGANAEYSEFAPEPRDVAALLNELGQYHAEKDLAKPDFLMPRIFDRCRYCRHQLYFALKDKGKIGIQACSSNDLPDLAMFDGAESIRSAWESVVMSTRRSLRQATVGEPCHDCVQFERCQGGCRTMASGSSGTFDSLDAEQAGYPHCPVAILLRENSDSGR
jgi:radical SAM protein with 4Fe4S-binding SPASM domain